MNIDNTSDIEDNELSIFLFNAMELVGSHFLSSKILVKRTPSPTADFFVNSSSSPSKQ